MAGTGAIAIGVLRSVVRELAGALPVLFWFQKGLMHTGTRYFLLSEQTSTTLSGCSVEISRDGSAIVVVDDEPLFRFSSLGALLSQYGLVRGELALP